MVGKREHKEERTDKYNGDEAEKNNFNFLSMYTESLSKNADKSITPLILINS